MDPAIFRKGNASSVLVVDKSWDDIIDKPDFFDELAERIVKMTDNAESIGLMLKSTPFGPAKNKNVINLKDAINKVLMEPLLASVEQDNVNVVKKDGSILVDALWDEIILPDLVWKKLYAALEKAYSMKLRIGESEPLTSADTLMDTKNTFNDTVLKPLLGINDDE